MANSWIPIGPSAATNGQAPTNPIVGGRVTDIAISAGSWRIYLGAEGGVWRSDDEGRSWRPLMDGFRLAPTFPDFQNRDRADDMVGVSALAVGAVVCDAENPDRVYAGTGVFAATDRGARGVGILMSDDGGESWTREPVAGGSDDLNGAIVYAMAIDPMDRNRAMAATSRGVYRRASDGGGGFHWEQVRVHPTNGPDDGLREHTSSVIVTRDTTTTPDTISWFIAQEGGEIYR
ncbi:MAG: WD40/YVTN/BNR-like repeat-containing protein, partial [Desulfococcaceae bacterium]